MRATLHIGLAILLVLAPAFCCCNIRALAVIAVASDVPTISHCPACPTTVASVALPEPASCCHSAPKAVSQSAPQPKPDPEPTPSRCCCLKERPDAIPPEQTAAIASEPHASDFLLVWLHVPAAIPPEHRVLVGGLDPPERAGVDARYEALFSRHVMRC